MRIKNNVIIASSISLLLICCAFFSFARNHNPLHQNEASVNLIIKLDNIESGTVTIDQLSNVSEVSAMVINAIDGTAINYTVNSFTFSASNVKGPKDSADFIENVKGNMLTRTIKQKILKLRPGSQIVIYNISATSPQNMNVVYGSTTWQVVANPTTIH